MWLLYFEKSESEKRAGEGRKEEMLRDCGLC
jgi:hypothetical protein